MILSIGYNMKSMNKGENKMTNLEYILSIINWVDSPTGQSPDRFFVSGKYCGLEFSKEQNQSCVDVFTDQGTMLRILEVWDEDTGLWHDDVTIITEEEWLRQPCEYHHTYEIRIKVDHYKS